jgi:hypothetical protein
VKIIFCGLILVVMSMIPSIMLGAGITGADILEVPIGVRPTALGGAYSALGDDVYIIDYNPAGLVRIDSPSIGLDNLQSFAGIDTQSISLAIPTETYGTFGAQIIYRGVPTIENLLATDPAVQAYDSVVIIGDGYRLGGIDVGVNIKNIFSELANEHAFTTAFDFGIALRVLGFRLATSVQNVGPGVRFEPGPNITDPLPLTYRLGIGRPLITNLSSSLLVAVELVQIFDQGFQESVGIEYWRQRFIALRMGYRNDPNNLDNGFSLGAAIRHNFGIFECEFGYAWHPASVIQGFTVNSNTFGILIWL